MNDIYNPKLRNLSRALRKNMTDQERMLWKLYLKDLKCVVKRQKIIGNYIVDFYIPEYKICIELDGGQHFETDGIKKDVERDKYLHSLGMTVLRYSNYEINTSFYEVCTDISNHLIKR